MFCSVFLNAYLYDIQDDCTGPNFSDKSITDKLRFLVKTLDAEIDENKQKILRYYLDSHPERFRKFPSVVGNKVSLYNSHPCIFRTYNK